MKRYEQDYEDMDECSEGEWVMADEAMKRIAELERERDEARELVRNSIHLRAYDYWIAYAKERDEAVKRWEVRGEAAKISR